MKNSKDWYLEISVRIRVRSASTRLGRIMGWILAGVAFLAKAAFFFLQYASHKGLI